MEYPDWCYNLSARVNNFFGGEPHLSLCGQAWLNKLEGKRNWIPMWFLELITLHEKDHCRKSYNHWSTHPQYGTPMQSLIPWGKVAVAIMAVALAGLIINVARLVIWLLLLAFPYALLFTAGCVAAVAYVALKQKDDTDGQ